MNTKLKAKLAKYLIAIGDDELVLAHRDSEWCGHAPILEEDIAFANISLDEIGHARLWYEIAAELLGEDKATYPDQLAFFRSASQFHSIQMNSLPNGDWAFTMLRQFLFDSAEVPRLEGLVESSHKPLAEAAVKIRNEEIYHLRHTSAWVKRLGLGTEESNRRMQVALDELWSYAQQLFLPIDGEVDLVAAGLVPDSAEIKSAWLESVVPSLEQADLIIPDEGPPPRDRSVQTQHLAHLITEMQSVARLEPQGRW
ncbi:MAG: phenylacetate-CoA oxygenase subunit PaaI [Chloroflexi bacterium]|nr:MAG: phenylacetate-CoA oxygenase subunit PaaI [Chloroflexota bacterium]MBL1193588.1 phenylacetate-CoA oxygenase subunit PaaI [Chloroflexota bacterium]NOH10879.1 phenylacetate-CoA oxygenase subunit PaaC [Chloroflexota bacterium]